MAKVDATGFQIGSTEHELLRLLGLAGFHEPDMIERVGFARLGKREVSWDAFVRRRAADGRRPAADGKGYGFRIVFAEAVQGPVAVKLRPKNPAISISSNMDSHSGSD